MRVSTLVIVGWLAVGQFAMKTFANIGWPIVIKLEHGHNRWVVDGVADFSDTGISLSKSECANIHYGLLKSNHCFYLMKLNLGCGATTPEGWVNVDYALGARLMKNPFFRILNRKLRLFRMEWSDTILVHDLTKTFPWADDSIDIVYSSHTLEHLTKEQGRHFLSESHRVLKKNGIIRIVVPNFRVGVTEYLEGRLQSDDYIDALGVLYKDSKNPIKKLLAPFLQSPHKCMYDEDRLVEVLCDIGFDASAKIHLESDIDHLHLLETKERTTYGAVAEGRKM